MDYVVARAGQARARQGPPEVGRESTLKARLRGLSPRQGRELLPPTRWLARTAECQSDFVRIARTSDVVKEPDDEGKAGPEKAGAASEDAGTPGAEAKELPEPTQIQTAPTGQSAGEDQHEGAASQPSPR